MGFLNNYVHPGKKKVEVTEMKQMEEKRIPIPPTPPMPAVPFSPRMGSPRTGPSPWSSRPTSIMSARTTRTANEEAHDVKCELMATWLYQEQVRKLWYGGSDEEGVVVKKSAGIYTSHPPHLDHSPDGFARAVEQLNVRSAMTVSSRMLQTFIATNDLPYIPLDDGLRLQIIPDFSYLPTCQKHQCAAYIADRALLVVWDDSPRKLISRAYNIEASIMNLIWTDELIAEEPHDEKKGASSTVYSVETSEPDTDVEKVQTEPPRKVVLIQAYLTAFTIVLAMAAISAGWRLVGLEIAADNNFVRVAFAVVVPIQLWCALFFFQTIAINLAQLFGPVTQMHINTKSYSGLPPPRLQVDQRGSLPHMTIQCPVYKEGLIAVIQPTIQSVKAAISTYEMQGGTANIFVNDDGMQLLSEDEARERQDFYDENNIGWVARPRHDPKGEHGEAFTRRGKFKKASNMNYAMWISNRIEDKLSAIFRPESWTQTDEAQAYQKALCECVEEDQGRTWADGNIRIGDYILIIDSDTRVPKDCLLNAVSEMEHSPQVAILQYASGVMNVTTSFFERGITFFTNLIYTQIKYAVANGDVAPFVGHNAVLRWSAVQSIAYDCPLEDDSREKYWSEDTVSEDFDMALRLQTEGYICRLGAYTGDGFKEGVSLTVYDELARWEKYAYGCSELLFHPLKYWLTRGPFTPLFRRFICSSMPLPSKFTIMAYIGTYYALGSAWILTLANYFLMGWYAPMLDKYYINSFEVYLSIIVVFTAFGNVALAVLRYRAGERGFLGALLENLTWIPLLLIFLGGVSMHVSQAILSHLFSVDMSWGATAKEVENTTFFKEVPKLVAKFKYTFVYCIMCAGMMVALALFVPFFWRIDVFVAVFPLAMNIAMHFFLPIVLNPSLMLFTW